MMLGVLHSVLAEEKADLRLRSAAYTAIGRLGQKVPAVITRDLNVVRVLFDALEQVSDESCLTVPSEPPPPPPGGQRVVEG